MAVNLERADRMNKKFKVFPNKFVQSHLQRRRMTCKTPREEEESCERKL